MNRRARRKGFGGTGAGFVFGILLCVLMPIFWRAAGNSGFRWLWTAMFIVGVLLLVLNVYIMLPFFEEQSKLLWRRLTRRDGK